MNNYGFIKVAAAVPTVSVADCNYNAEQIIGLMQSASEKGVKVMLFPELSITGCSCGDLFLQPLLLKRAQEALMQIVEASAYHSLVAIVGLPLKVGDKLYNCAAVLSQGVLVGVVPKGIISRGERQELRHFAPGTMASAEEVEIAGFTAPFGVDLSFAIDGVQFGVEIGDEAYSAVAPSIQLAQSGAKLIFNPSAMVAKVANREFYTTHLAAHTRATTTAYVTAMAGFGESTTDLVYAADALIVENGKVLASAGRHPDNRRLH